MKKINNMQNIEERCEKKSYKEPQLKRIGSLANLTMANGLSQANDGTKTKGTS